MMMIGVLGGMGPAATHLFHQKLTKSMSATCDQEHIPTLTIHATWVPDRTAALQSNDPLQRQAVAQGLRRAAAILRDAGSRVVCMPCNTAHAWHGAVAKEAGPHVQVSHMIDLVSAKLRRQGVRRVALLASHGTRMSGIYERSMEEAYAGSPFEFIYPTQEEQRILYEEGIMGIKAGIPGQDIFSKLEPCIDRLWRAGAERIILGCTEIPVIFEHVKENIPGLIDPMDELARVVVAHCRNYRG